ncbi:transcriptional regulator [Brasilonema octagenarum UFV-E1]|uniref:Transcriptional regulator n=2 Tax=Brasilonema TaxID=383614 RepID=A0A856MC18_9CYAN|nr:MULTISPECIES: GUN4 domain-containing protein [Brasilonema]NMF67422.1 transcriptional regulator [Brasilonema octagenarum UFV-OR1]QDL08815.1 transcriptional regulator [Brasilonema sennae CENA114]QDL15172.1 transcriptional regulator [Brasilonema octagenarum UFV-E1]
MTTSQDYEVFLCHNSKEKQQVERIRAQLKQQGILAWLDKYDFEPFRPWQDQLEEIIPQIKAVAVFIGSSGVGPWANIEMREFLVEFASRQLRMGLVILPDCPQELINSVPRFIKSFHWVDFRQQEPDPMEQLIWGITGHKPVPTLKVIPQSQSDDLSSEPNKEVPTTQELRNPEVIKTQNTPQNQRDDSGDDLSSERGVNYTKLRNLLKAGQWKEADLETVTFMLKAAGREIESWLDIESIKNFPCTDLRTIDQLWVKYSSGRFGFSVQKRVWESVGKDYEKFGDRVGWRKGMPWKKEWLYYNELTFSTKAPQGHLPVWGFRGVKKNEDLWPDLFSRVQTCKL